MSAPGTAELLDRGRTVELPEAESKENYGCMGPYVGADYNLTFCPLQSRLQHIYHGQPYARVDLNPMPESTLSPSQGLGFGPWSHRILWSC